MAKISKTLTLANAEEQTISFDTVTNDFELVVGTRDPVTWSRGDVKRTFEVLQTMRRIDHEWEALQSLS